MSFLSNLFGGGSKNQISYTPQGISTPGISVSPGGSLSESPTLQANIGGLQSTFAQGANAFGQLAGTVQPGFSQLRQAGLNQLATTQQATLSNLQNNLAQRRILGSSFANSQISQSQADYAQSQANFVAQSYLSELQASTQLTQQQYSMATQTYSSAISQANIEAGIAANLTSSNNSIMAQIATANADLQAKAAAGAGSFAGTLLGLGTGGGNTLGGSMFSSLGSMFGGSAMSAGTAADVAGSFGLSASDIGAGATMSDALPALLALA